MLVVIGNESNCGVGHLNRDWNAELTLSVLEGAGAHVERNLGSRWIGFSGLLQQLELRGRKKLIARWDCVITAARAHSQIGILERDADLPELPVEIFVFGPI